MLDNIEFLPQGPVGAFEKTYLIQQMLSSEQQQSLIEWLATNLSDNFIFLETTRRTLAGGYSDNYRAWQHGRFKKPEQRYPEYEVRICKADIAVFEMVWYKNIRKIDVSSEVI